MGRPVQPLGTFGSISVRTVANGYVASTRFRELTGKYRRVTASGETPAAAERRLKEKIAAGLGPRAAGDLTGQTRLAALVDVWLTEIEERAEHAPQTIEIYRDVARRIVVPVIGDLRLSEVSVGILDRFLKSEAQRAPSRARHARVVLAQVLDLAVRHDVLDRNPVRGTAPIRRSRSSIRSLTLDEINEIRRILREYRTAPGTPGPPPDGQLAQIFEVMLGTSARLGEALAIRRQDVDLASTPPTVTFTGTIVQIIGKGFIRQPHPKHSKYWRTVAIPTFTADALAERFARSGPQEPDTTVFHTKQGTPLSPGNVRRLWRAVRDAYLREVPDGVDLTSVIPHTLRKTVATALDEAAGIDLAAELLGHSSSAVTRAHYVQPRERVDPRTAEILEALRPRRDDNPPPAITD